MLTFFFYMSKANNLPYYIFLWLVASMFYFYQFIVRIIPSIISTNVMSDLNLTASYFGFLSSVWYFGYAIFQIPMGILLDKINPKIVISLSCLGCAFSSYIFSISDSSFELLFARIFTGICSSAGFLGVVKVGSLLFPISFLPIITGTASTLGTLAPIFFNVHLVSLNESIGWRDTLFYISMSGILLSIFIVSLLNIDLSYLKTKDFKNNDKKIIDDVMSISSNKEVFIVAYVGLILYLTITAIADLWGVNFFRAVYGLDLVKSTEVNSIIYIGFGFGALLIGWINKLIKNTYLIWGVSSILILIILLLCCSEKIGAPSLLFFMCLLGIISSSECLVFSKASELTSRNVGITTGFVNAIVMLGGLFFQTIIGFVLDFTWRGNLDINGHKIYGKTEYLESLYVVIIMLVISAIVSFRNALRT